MWKFCVLLSHLIGIWTRSDVVVIFPDYSAALKNDICKKIYLQDLLLSNFLGTGRKSRCAEEVYTSVLPRFAEYLDSYKQSKLDETGVWEVEESLPTLVNI